jgi:predicted heme/steroid binding protein
MAGLLICGLLIAFLSGISEKAMGDSCPNSAARTGPSAALQNCRGYELVTPPGTISSVGLRVSPESGGFNTSPSDPSGNNVLFNFKGEALPGTDATGSDDSYLAERTSAGWLSRRFGPTGEEAEQVISGGTAENHQFGFTRILRQGTLPVGRYVVEADNSLRVLGDGSLADDPRAMGRWISPSGEHIVFTSENRLEPDAPEGLGCCTFNFWGVAANEPVNAVYERTPTGSKVLSLLPGDAPIPDGSTTYYWGTSKDGSSVVFNVGEFFGQNGTLYVHHNGTTYPIVTVPWAEEAIYMGGSSSGETIYYLIDEQVFFGGTSGRLYEYDVNSQQSRQVTSAPDVQVVNVSEDGSHVYFVSGEQLDGSMGTPGAANLYVWDGNSTTFVAELAPEDIGQNLGGKSLINWPLVVTAAQQATLVGPGVDPSRTTADGSVFVFEAQSNLTSYDSEGHTEIYRYSTGSGEISCISCDPTGAPPTSDARLQGVSSLPDEKEAPTAAAAEVHNIRSDGKAVFFMSGDRLVPGDTDGKLDVYEWSEDHIALISYGRSGGTNEWLYAASTDGSNVFFTSSDRLVPDKEGDTPSIYDARVNGGFAPASSPVPCLVGSCQGAASTSPAEPAVGTATAIGRRNIKPRPRRKACRKLGGKKRKRCLRAHHHPKKNGTKTNGRAG